MPWTLEKIDTRSSGMRPALLDFNGVPGIVYAGEKRRSVRFAQMVGSKWATSTIRPSKRGVIRSIDAEETFSGQAIAVFIDAPFNVFKGNPNRVSQIIYASFDGNRWKTSVIRTAAFPKKFFYACKIVKASDRFVIGWLERAPNTRFKLMMAESRLGINWSISQVPGTINIGVGWDMIRVSGRLVVSYFDKASSELKYIERVSPGTWTSPATVVSVSSNESLIGTSITELDGEPHISFQINFGSKFLTGTQRHVERKNPTWTQTNVEQPIVPSNIRNNATSIHQIGTPTIAYHLRNPDRINYAIFVSDTVYAVGLWVIEEVGKNIIMPSHKHIDAQAYIACYDIKTRNLILAKET